MCCSRRGPRCGSCCRLVSGRSTGWRPQHVRLGLLFLIYGPQAPKGKTENMFHRPGIFPSDFGCAAVRFLVVCHLPILLVIFWQLTLPVNTCMPAISSGLSPSALQCPFSRVFWQETPSQRGRGAAREIYEFQTREVRRWAGHRSSKRLQNSRNKKKPLSLFTCGCRGRSQLSPLSAGFSLFSPLI